MPCATTSAASYATSSRRGFGAARATDVAMATHDADLSLRTVIAGLGGRAITQRSIESMLADAIDGRLEALTFLDLDQGIIERERARMAGTKRSGPTAENVLRDLGTVASRIG